MCNLTTNNNQSWRRDPSTSNIFNVNSSRSTTCCMSLNSCDYLQGCTMFANRQAKLTKHHAHPTSSCTAIELLKPEVLVVGRCSKHIHPSASLMQWTVSSHPAVPSAPQASSLPNLVLDFVQGNCKLHKTLPAPQMHLQLN